ncbi:MAG: hypothetical protein HQK64_12425 [Desulfamplus sp.]|nr:hypothetical protein [Desulfamplus sp.]MBF0243265.1 hypothetical protein [Desulfamplus sp.]
MGSILKKVSKTISKDVSSKLSKNFSKEAVGEMAMKAGIAFVRNVVTKKGISTNIKFLIESYLFNETETKDIPEKVMQDALSIKDIFNRAGITPQKIAIDGVPGSGKSVLSYALGNLLEMKAISLDHCNMDQKINFISKPAIFEHHRLLRTQNIDCFDAIIYIDEPFEDSMAKVLHRKRGSYLVDIMNFDLMKKIGKKAFELADGDIYSVPNSFIKVKIRVGHSYNVMENIANELLSSNPAKLQKIGDSQDIENSVKIMAKEAMLFFIEDGRFKKGFTAYLNPIAYKQDLINAILDAVGGKTKLPFNLSSSRNS